MKERQTICFGNVHDSCVWKAKKEKPFRFIKRSLKKIFLAAM